MISRSAGRNGLPTFLVEVDVQNRHLQGEARALRIVGGNDAQELGAVVELDGVGLLEPRDDSELVVVEQLPEVVLQHGAADRDLHRKGERAVAVLIVHRDRADLALAERHVRGLRRLRIRRHLQRRRAKRLAQEFAQLDDLGLGHAPHLSLDSLPRGFARSAGGPQGAA